ncbi:hypothetical protein [Oceanobacillus rekensis]|uniref:hypothetical protein n=1 Tax=Oceanobacillus rekensis TaxID=937927 RepID=UPI000B430147|nr:hypothetical protein [Oceanobacillus rekensis]
MIMISPEERLLFIREIYKLEDEYERCTDNTLKGEIYDEIKRLNEILDFKSCFTIYANAGHSLNQNN